MAATPYRYNSHQHSAAKAWQITATEPVGLLVKGRVVDVNTGTLKDRAIAVDDGEIVALAPASLYIDLGHCIAGRSHPVA